MCSWAFLPRLSFGLGRIKISSSLNVLQVLSVFIRSVSYVSTKNLYSMKFSIFPDKLGWVLKNKNPTTFFTHPSTPSQEGTFQIPLLRGARGVLFIAQRKKIGIPERQDTRKQYTSSII